MFKKPAKAKAKAPKATAKQAVIRTDSSTEIQNWAILGLDLSLSRTGYASLFMKWGKTGAEVKERWGVVGSYTMGEPSKDEDAWARAQSYAIGIGMEVARVWEQVKQWGGTWGLLIAMETPDPTNSYLMSINGIIQTSLWNPTVPYYGDFVEVRRMLVNAATLASLMEVNFKGATKKDNRAKAYSFLPADSFPRMDTDACDAVLLCKFASWGLHLLHGNPGPVPLPAQLTLARDGMRVKVKATSQTTGEVLRTEESAFGLLYNPDLWTRMTFPKLITMKRADAARPKPKLETFNLEI